MADDVFVSSSGSARICADRTGAIIPTFALILAGTSTVCDFSNGIPQALQPDQAAPLIRSAESVRIAPTSIGGTGELDESVASLHRQFAQELALVAARMMVSENTINDEALGALADRRELYEYS